MNAARKAKRSPYLRVRSLSVSYPVGGSLSRRRFTAVERVSFAVEEGTCYALVGESGSGKSTVAGAVLGLNPIDSGSITLGSFTLPGLKRNEKLAFRKAVQAIFQDPYLSLNPRHSVGQLIAEPLVIHNVKPAERDLRISQVLDRVSLDREVLSRRPSQLSGGQRQRVCIARSLVLRPRLLIADEPVSALDLSVQARIIDLLSDLKEKDGLTLLFVSHDMELVQFIADRVGVMHRGRLVETGTSAELFSNPLHPYTRSLLDAVPANFSMTEPVEPSGPAEEGAGPGCHYCLNCADADMKCRYEPVPLIMVNPDHKVACYKFGGRDYR